MPLSSMEPSHVTSPYRAGLSLDHTPPPHHTISQAMPLFPHRAMPPFPPGLSWGWAACHSQPRLLHVAGRCPLHWPSFQTGTISKISAHRQRGHHLSDPLGKKVVHHCLTWSPNISNVADYQCINNSNCGMDISKEKSPRISCNTRRDPFNALCQIQCN